jgi:hypothetical protein
VPPISQYKLKGMLPGGQAHVSLSLASAEMQVCKVVWNRLIERRQLGIDQQMVMSGILSVGARRCYSHTAKPKMNGGLGWQRIAVLDVNEINGGPWRGRRRSTASRGLAVNNCGCRNPD